MSTNFKNGYTNTGDGMELPLGDIYKRPWELKQTEIFDDFLTYNADNYNVQKTGTGTVALVNNERDGVLRLTTTAGASDHVTLRWAGGTGAALGCMNSLDGVGDILCKIRFKLDTNLGTRNDDGSLAFGLTGTGSSNFPFFFFGPQYTAVVAGGDKDSTEGGWSVVIGNSAIAGRLATPDFIDPVTGNPQTYLPQWNKIVGDGNYHTLAIQVQSVRPGTGKETTNAKSSGNEKVIKFYFDNQLIKSETAVSGRIKYNVDNNSSAFSVADNADASNPTKAGGLVPFFGISNASTAQPIQADVDYVYYSIEKNKGEI
mgnify:FL=1